MPDRPAGSRRSPAPGESVDGRLFVADSFGKAFGDRKVLKAASCWARPGRVTVLLGRNGSGKSTLLKAALGLVRADYGIVKWDGKATLSPRLATLANEGLFYVPERGLLSRRLRVEQHLRALCSRFQSSTSLDEWDPLQIAPFRERRSRDLSGGERRSVELTLGLLRNPRCLVADEPLQGMAPLSQERFAAAVKVLASRGCAVLLTGHEVDRLFDLADEVIWIVAGGTYGLGTPAEARAHQQFRREYLGSRHAD